MRGARECFLSSRPSRWSTCPCFERQHRETEQSIFGRRNVGPGLPEAPRVVESGKHIVVELSGVLQRRRRGPLQGGARKRAVVIRALRAFPILL